VQARHSVANLAALARCLRRSNPENNSRFLWRDQPRSPHPPCSEQPVWPNFAARGCPRPRRRVAPGAASPGPRHRVSAEFVICFRCCAATGPWYRRPVTEAGQRALIAHKRMNWFANPPRTQKRYRNPRGFRKKEVKLQAALVALGKARTCVRTW
jgi:hypothetical protein